MRFVNRVLRVLLPSSGADTLLGTRSRGGDSYVGVPPSNKDISENASATVVLHEEAQHDVSSYYPADTPGPGTKNCMHSRILYCPLPNIRNPSHEEEMSNVAHFTKGDPTSILYRNKILVLFKLLLCSSFFATQNPLIIVSAVPASVSENPLDFSSLELLEASNPEDVLSKRIGDLRVDAAAMERSFGNDVEIVEWPVLNNVNRFIETLKDVIPFSYSSGDEDSSVDLYKSLGTLQAFENDIQKLALSLVRDSSSQNSIGENINRLHEISAVVLSLEHFLSNSPQQSFDLLPEEFHRQLPEVLSKTAGALGDVRAIVGNIPGVKESPLESFSSAVQTRSIASSDEANASKNSKVKSKSRRIKSSDITCDELLQEFHRFDESKGKWMGGSVTSICRGWGTTKSVSLQAIYYGQDEILYNGGPDGR